MTTVDNSFDPDGRQLVHRATGLLRTLNRAGILEAADVHVALRLARLGEETDERVLLAAALTVRALRSGSVCFDLETSALVDADVAWPTVTDWTAALRASDLVGDQRVLRLDGAVVYLDRYWHEEGQVCVDLLSREEAMQPVLDSGRLATLLSTYFPDDEYADQRVAAGAAADHRTSVITGGPGTGKTTTIARLLGVLSALAAAGDGQPLRIALAAPTGKAAARMAQAVREATQHPDFPVEHRDTLASLSASTLHRLLGSRPDNRTRFRHHRGNRLPHDVVVVDETSMVSLTMMARLLEAVRPEARLVLVGDADQLASVDAGAVLKDLVEGLGARGGAVSRLDTSRRFGAAIGDLAAAVNGGDTEEALALLAGTTGAVSLVEPGDLERYLVPPALAAVTAAEGGDRAAALAALDRHRLLCAHREGPFGVTWWNRQVERWLMEHSGRDFLPRWYAGQPLIVNANDYGLGLFNGDTGVVCRDAEAPGGLVALIADGEHAGGTAYPLTRLAEVSTAHAMTVHRSQGSQFDEVTVLLPDPTSPVLTRELLYTAITRARRAVRIVGTEESLRAAIDRPARRATGLARRLGGA